jgi:hypothetical protein
MTAKVGRTQPPAGMLRLNFLQTKMHFYIMKVISLQVSKLEHFFASSKKGGIINLNLDVSLGQPRKGGVKSVLRGRIPRRTRKKTENSDGRYRADTVQSGGFSGEGRAGAENCSTEAQGGFFLPGR